VGNQWKKRERIEMLHQYKIYKIYSENIANDFLITTADEQGRNVTVWDISNGQLRLRFSLWDPDLHAKSLGEIACWTFSEFHWMIFLVYKRTIVIKEINDNKIINEFFYSTKGRVLAMISGPNSKETKTFQILEYDMFNQNLSTKLLQIPYPKPAYKVNRLFD
jgi:hypothetical protein